MEKKRSFKELCYFVLSAVENSKSSFKERSLRQRKKSRIVPPGLVGTDDVGRNGETKGKKTLVEVNQSNSQVRTARKRCDWIRRCGKTSVFTALQKMVQVSAGNPNLYHFTAAPVLRMASY